MTKIGGEEEDNASLIYSKRHMKRWNNDSI